ncbi:MAG TPA: type II secretion system F family protein [Caulobacteraceae bacterium]|jgi:tight adherence protein B
MLVILAYVLAFVAVVILVQTIASVVMNAGDRTRRVNRRLDLLDSGMSREKVYETLVRRRSNNALANAAPALYDRFVLFFRQAGVTVSPARFGLILGGIALVLVFVGLVVMGMLHSVQGAGLVNLLVAIVGAVVLALVGGLVWLGWRRSSRLKKLEEQLPLALDITIRALRAGHPVVMAMKLASEESADPIGSEFGLIVDETNFGLEFREALVNFAHRTGSEYAHFFAVCVSIQSETGGNLAEILNNLATVIRNMQTLHLRVRALAAEGKMSAQILTLLPVGMVGFLMLTRPGFYTSKFGDPAFWPAVGVIFLIFLLGQFTINRMVNFKY